LLLDLVIAANESDGCDKDAAGCHGQKENCVTVGSLGGGRRGGRVVFTLGAALGVGDSRGPDGCGEESDGEGEFCEMAVGRGVARLH
jgi:hypothetical protein